MKIINIIPNTQSIFEAKVIGDYHRGMYNDDDDDDDDSSSSGYKRRMPLGSILNKHKKSRKKNVSLPSNTPPIRYDLPDWDAVFVFTGHFRDRIAERHINYNFMVDELSNILEKHKDTIQSLPDDEEFVIRDRFRFNSIIVVHRNDDGSSTYYAVTMLPATKARSTFEKFKYVFNESDDRHPIKLGDLVTMSKGMEDADFWIEYRGSINTVGKPSKEYGPHKLGIKVTATDRLDPKYLYYMFMHLHNQGQFAKIANGTTNLVNIRIRDIANIPLAMSESIAENDDEPVRITLRGFPKSPDDRPEASAAKRWIDHLYATLPTNPLNPDQLALVYGEGANQQIALFELEPVKGDPKTVYVKWFQAYPMRQGVGTRAMKELQDMAGKAGLKLNLISWNHGKVPRRALDKFYKKVGFKPSSGKLSGLTWDPLSETDAVTFAGKDPREFTSPNGGKAAMVIVTAQGSRYLITDDGMVLRHKSAHANTGGDDQGLKNWSQHIEFYDPSEKVGGTTFPLAVSAAVSKNLPVALSKTPDGLRALAILDNGKWRVAKISDVFKHVAKDDVPIAGKYSTSPKLHWHTMDYDINSKGMLSRVHPGSPVSHGAVIKHAVNENDDDYGVDDTPDIKGAKKCIQDVKRDFDSLGELPVNGLLSDLQYRYNLDNATIGKLIEPIKSDIVVYINTMLNQGGHPVYGAVRRIYKLFQYDIAWPELYSILNMHRRHIIKYMLDKIKVNDIGVVQEQLRHLKEMGIDWPELVTIRNSVVPNNLIAEVGPAIDNVYGLGAVGISGNINYMGLRVYVKPSVFLKLAARHPDMQTDYIQQHMSGGKAIGAPFLDINIPSEWIDKSSRHDQVAEGDLTEPAMVIGHEGRHRMAAILKDYGDDPIETHLVFRGLRRRHITDNMIERLNQDIVNENGRLYQGSWFNLTDVVTETDDDDIDFDTNFVEQDFLKDLRNYGILVAITDISNKAERDARFYRDTAIYHDTVIDHKSLIIRELLKRMSAATSHTEFLVIDDSIAYLTKKLKLNWPELNIIRQSCKAHVAALPDDHPGYDELDEKWSKKYKNSINCSNPKGFSQRAHCAGKKKR